MGGCGREVDEERKEVNKREWGGIGHEKEMICKRERKKKGP